MTSVTPPSPSPSPSLPPLPHRPPTLQTTLKPTQPIKQNSQRIQSLLPPSPEESLKAPTTSTWKNDNDEAKKCWQSAITSSCNGEEEVSKNDSKDDLNNYSDDDSSSTSSSFSMDDYVENESLETSSDTEEECMKRPCLDEDLASDWYNRQPFRRRDQRQCDEYFLRGRSLLRCIRHLYNGYNLGQRHSHRIARTLYAGKHNCLEHRTKNSEYVSQAHAEFEAMIVLLHRQNPEQVKHYVAAALVTVQKKSHMLLLHVRLMKVVLLLLRQEHMVVQDLQTLVELCDSLDYIKVQRYLQRPLCEVLVGVVHSLLCRISLTDLRIFLHQHHRVIYELACAPILGRLAYHGDPFTQDTALLHNNCAKVFHDYLGQEAQLLLLTAMNASLTNPTLGRLSDLLLDRLARAVSVCSVPPSLLLHFQYHFLTSNSHPGPRGSVAVLRLLRRCHHQLRKLSQLPQMLHRLVALLVVCNDRPLTTARDLARFLHTLRMERISVMHRPADFWQSPGDEETQAFVVHLLRLVVTASWACALPSTSIPASWSEWDSDEESDESDEHEIEIPSLRELLATLMGLCGTLVEPRASWSSLACEISHLLAPHSECTKDYHLLEELLGIAINLERRRCQGLQDLPEDYCNRNELLTLIPNCVHSDGRDSNI